MIDFVNELSSLEEDDSCFKTLVASAPVSKKKKKLQSHGQIAEENQDENLNTKNEENKGVKRKIEQAPPKIIKKKQLNLHNHSLEYSGDEDLLMEQIDVEVQEAFKLLKIQRSQINTLTEDKNKLNKQLEIYGRQIEKMNEDRKKHKSSTILFEDFRQAFVQENKELTLYELHKVFNKYSTTFPINHIHRKTLTIYATEATKADVENVIIQLTCILSDRESQNSDPGSKLFPIDNHKEMKKIFKKLKIQNLGAN